ncbi:fibrillin-2 isoform X5 [Cherax quadricarinatus]|uniref:fibrillin-2 isoform X5 n=1 Tax=Cherax quadricarinatus TaxID=27406 RepID=UPI00387E4338
MRSRTMKRPLRVRLGVYTALLLLLFTATAGDLEPTFGRCCAYGANWAREAQQCSTFPAPVSGIPSEHQSICITAAGICCLRYFRDEQCQKGKQAAQVGQDCVSSSNQGGEYFKDCCQGCKLGLFSGSMGMGCNMGFKFGFPWDSAFVQCCMQVAPGSAASFPDIGNKLVDLNNLYPGVISTTLTYSESDDLCARFAGKLCAHVCVPTPGSYRCQCRAGFTLSTDNKSCIQDALIDRCRQNNPCAHICRDTGVSIECSCNPGYNLAPDQRTCEDVNECSSGVHGCLPGEQVCYNQIGSYACINADGSLSSPGGVQHQTVSTGSATTHLGDARAGAALGSSSYDINNEVDPGIPGSILGRGALGVQGFPGTRVEHRYLDATHSQGRCPPGYNFNLDTIVCDDVDECEVTSGLCGRGAVCQNTIGSYTCAHIPVADCPPGFAFDLNQQSCLDIDECLDGSNNCNQTTHFCINTNGAFTCQQKGGPTDCIAGYKYSSQQQTCVDVDECLEELHGCNPEEETCRNTAGAYECDIKCDDGFHFSLSLQTCVDQDECVELPCESGWQCHNTAGSYQCLELPRAFCPAGYKPLNGTVSGCEDVDECAENLHTCHSLNEICINEIGKYRCEPTSTNEVDEGSKFEILTHATFQTPVQECPEGFGFDLNTSQCLDIDECSTNLDDCSVSERCINTLGSYTCRLRRRCSAGYATDLITGECKDVDECATGIASCLPGQICFNTEGAFECRVECQDGFRYDPTDAAVCVDIDECLESPCEFGKLCTNIEGSYICTSVTTQSTRTTTFTTTSATTTTTSRPPSSCPSGFGRNPNSLQCEDIDECRNQVCEPEQSCQNSYGSYRCIWLPCDRGYTRDSLTHECQDIDECEEGLHSCQVGVEQCVNNPGGHTCQPQPCASGFTRDSLDPRQCIDIDECKLAPCGPEEECINSNGSFRCRHLTPCSPGFRRDEESKECKDIDECIENAPCTREERCVNTFGSYRCRSLDCNAGYQRDEQGRCRDVDECVTGEHTCQVPKEECINTQGSYRCKTLPECPRGLIRDPSLLRCVDVDECTEGTHDCHEGERCYNQYGTYKCRASSNSCTKGFRYNAYQRRCKDIDECAEKADTCEGSTQTCVNSVGSFRCIDRQPTCDFGFQYDEELKACVDINECEEGRDICNKLTEICHNSVGNYWCAPSPNPVTTSSTTNTATTTSASTNIFRIPPPPPLPPRPDQLCQPGTLYDTLFKICIDIDECISNPCPENEICENTHGSFRCNCRTGFSREESSKKCEDQNECQLGSHTCSQSQRCDNTIGSFVCIRIAGCGTGYTLNHNTGECDDNDECKLNTHDCNQLGPKYQCFNIRGSFRCKEKTCPQNQILIQSGLCINLTCDKGFRPIEGICQDINECAEGIPCQRNEQCINTRGSYTCRSLLNCGAGYQMNEYGTQCIDIDECADGTHQCRGNQVCSNRQGGYICQCPTGFKFNEIRQCQDFNECETYPGSVCSGNAVCENTEGSFRCNCKEGFKQSNDGRTCLDVNECIEIPGICHHNCINVWGSHQCTCRAGHNLARDNRTCSDINECEEYRGRGRLCIGICVNTIGTFKCSCPDGYNLVADGRTCKDINECDSGNVCRGENEHCVNTHGGYKCNSITCPANYIRDTRHKNRCKKVSLYCLEDDESCHREPLSYSYNFLPLVSNLSLPTTGQVDLFTMRGPLWLSTTVQFELELESARAPLGVEAATREFFYLKHTSFNQAVISLVKSISGPQEIQLVLNMQLYQQGKYTGSAIAKLLIYVSEYDF